MYDGVNKWEETSWGFKLSLSKSTLLWMGAGVSGSGLLTFLLGIALGPITAVVSAIAQILCTLGIPFFIGNSVFSYGVTLSFLTVGLPIPLLIGIEPQPAPAGGGGGEPHHFL